MHPANEQWLRGLVRDEVSNILNPKVIIKRARDNKLPEPAYMHEGDAGLALYADFSTEYTGVEPFDLTIKTGCSLAIRCGWHFHWPPGFVGLVMGRSGLSFKRDVRVFYVGTIDQGYTGEISVKLENMSNDVWIVKHGDQIAQLLILPVAHALVQQGEMPVTPRGENGFGSTDKLTKTATGLGAVEASQLIHEHAQRDQALRRDDKVRFHVMTPKPEQFSPGALFVLNQDKDITDARIVWRLVELHERQGPAMVTLENTATRARITVQHVYLRSSYFYLGHMWSDAAFAINTTYIYNGHKYAIRDRSEVTACAFLVPVNKMPEYLDASTWVRIDKLKPPLWRLAE